MIAIATGIILQIFLMVRFTHEELKSIGWLNLCADLSFDFSTGLHFVANLFGDFLLFVGMSKDHRTVLSASIVALPIQRRRIVHAKEEANQIGVGLFAWIEGKLQDFSMISRAGTDIFVVGLRSTTHVTDERRE